MSSNATCLPEIAGSAAMLANPLKAEEIASAMIALSQNSDLRNKKIEAGFSNARRFSWHRSAETIMGIYEAVYAQSRAIEKQSGPYDKHVLAARD